MELSSVSESQEGKELFMFMQAVLFSVYRLHSTGILHCDITFENYGFEGVMLGSSGYLFDFGRHRVPGCFMVLQD